MVFSKPISCHDSIQKVLHYLEVTIPNELGNMFIVRIFAICTKVVIFEQSFKHL